MGEVVQTGGVQARTRPIVAVWLCLPHRARQEKHGRVIALRFRRELRANLELCGEAGPGWRRRDELRLRC